jgi:alkaline phosphatase
MKILLGEPIMISCQKFFTYTFTASVIISLISCGTSTTPSTQTKKNVIFFLGDGMGMTTMTAARIYSVGEDGQLTMDTLPETAIVKTFSQDAMVTDSAPSMSAYMTGVKMNNDVLSMSSDTYSYNPNSSYLKTDVTTSAAAYSTNIAQAYYSTVATGGADSTCPTSGNGSSVQTLLELAKASGKLTGVVTTTRITHATPAATYAHICNRDGENQIAAQLVSGSGDPKPQGAYNTALGNGVDVILGGGLQHFIPQGTSTPVGSGTASSARTDNNDLTAKMVTNGYTFVKTRTDFLNIDTTKFTRLLGLFNSSHMTYELDRKANSKDEPSLSEMAVAATKILSNPSNNSNGFFLMVEGGRIDHALHATQAQRALVEAVEFDNAIKAVMSQMNIVDPGLKNTLIVVTADHDHTMVLNGYAKRTGPTTLANLGILGFLRNYATTTLGLDGNQTTGNPFTIIGFGNGPGAISDRTTITAALETDSSNGPLNPNYRYESTIPMPAGDNETHGGGDVFLGAIGMNAGNFKGVIENKDVFNLIRTSAGF